MQYKCIYSLSEPKAFSCTPSPPPQPPSPARTQLTWSFSQGASPLSCSPGCSLSCSPALVPSALGKRRRPMAGPLFKCRRFYMLVYGLVAAIPVPSYFEQPKRYTRHMHPLLFRQIHTYVCYYKYSFFP